MAAQLATLANPHNFYIKYDFQELNHNLETDRDILLK